MTTQGALAGVRVVDLSTRLSGAFCARIFGDTGADVVLLEPPEGHPLRAQAPFLDDQPGPERSLLHALANLNKRSATLAPDDPRRAALLRAADIIVISSRADADAAAHIAGEQAIIAGVTPYGLDSSMAEIPGNDLTAYAATGWALTNGYDGHPPLQGVHHQPSYIAGVMAYLGAVSALHERDQSGLGQTVDVCEMEPLAWMAAPSILSASHGEPRSRRTPRVFGGPVPVRDGHISITFSRPHFWAAAMQTLGLDELADDPRYKTSLARRPHMEALAPVIEERLKTLDRWPVFNDLAERRSTVGVVLDVADLAQSEQLRGRDVIVRTEVDGQPVEILHAPCRMSATPWQLRRHAPKLGQHTDDILTEWAATTTEVPA